MPKPDWTPAQLQAIHTKGGTMLVSAAAGSGKTAVLVERVVQLICATDNPVSVDQLLVVTFSNAAAAEMKQRVGLRLSQLIRDNPAAMYLQKQQTMLGSAAISTVHAFCLDLIRQNFQNLAISPDFSVIDEAELALLKEQCVAETIEFFYAKEQDRDIFQQLVELLTTGRDDSRLQETVFRIFDFARSHPFYKQWLDTKLAMYNPALPPEETVWGQSIFYHAEKSLAYAITAMEHAMVRIAQDEKLIKGYQPMFADDLLQLRALQEACKAKDWNTAVGLVRRFTFLRLGSVRGECPDKETVQGVREDVKKIVEELATRNLNATTKEFQQDIAVLRPTIEVLFEVVKTFGDTLEKEKQIRKKLDFSDLEHLALELLVHPDRTPTPQALEIAQQYQHILVDEYQDTNEVQDLIFASISRKQENLFMVGDVKQSIYSFRMAMPELFMQKREEYSLLDQGKFPATVILDTNFRSRSGVTDSVNFIFQRMMSKELGEITYNQEETLKPGASFLPNPAANPELLLLNAESYEGGLRYTQLEGVEVAKKISAMLESDYQVQEGHGDGAVLRPARPSDFCILLRSHKNKAEDYVEALTKQGVPAWAENTGGFLQAREVSAVVSLLKVLDNPLLDIELAAALLSPLFDFTADDLVEIRLQARGISLYLALTQSAQQGYAKAVSFLETFTTLRRFAVSNPADALLQEIYRMTHFLEIVRVMPLGESRYANLLLLLEYAAHYHGIGYKGVAGFVALLERIEDRGGDLAPANRVGDTANVVRVMSIHRSKGLEFPIVILADSAKEFNLQDLREITLLHSEYGFASVRRNPKTLAQYPTVPMGAIRQEIQKTLLSEEMRVLYVALTRAREKIIVVSTIRRRFEKTLAALVEDLSKEESITPYRVGTGKSYSDWIIMALMHHPSAKALRVAAGDPQVALVADATPWGVTVAVPDGKPREKTTVKKEHTAQPDPLLRQRLETASGYEYPFAIQTRLPTKMAVSDLVFGEENRSYRFTRRPRFLTKGGLTPAEVGTAMHGFMQFADYQKAKDNLPQEIQRMEEQGYLLPIQVASLSQDRLAEFFSSPLADRLFASEQVYRELRFMAEFGKEELSGVVEEIDDHSKIVLQGVADCIFVEQGKGIIVDYKTDRVASLEDLRQRYQTQLLLYEKILADSLGVPVGETILYSFHLSAWIDTTNA